MADLYVCTYIYAAGPDFAERSGFPSYADLVCHFIEDYLGDKRDAGIRKRRISAGGWFEDLVDLPDEQFVARVGEQLQTEIAEYLYDEVSGESMDWTVITDGEASRRTVTMGKSYPDPVARLRELVDELIAEAQAA